jgi:arylformamidase
MTILDISTPLREGFPVWPGHSPVRFTTTESHEAGNGVHLTHLSFGAHTSTHLDAPLHFIADGGLVTGLDLNTLIGRCHVVHYPGDGPIPVSFFEAQALPDPIERLLLKCNRNAGKLEQATFFEDYAALSIDAAQYLVDRGLKLIGTDYLSIGPFHHGNPEVHRILLGTQVIIVEGLDLRRVEAGPYTLVCLPVALPLEGAPCRTVLLPADARF